ncbi:MAG: DUF2177 family protein [Myxococcota bacterium]
MTSLSLFVRALVIYVVVDVAYQAVVGLRLLTTFVAKAGLEDVFVPPEGPGLLMMLVFFALLAWANVQLAIRPAIAAGSVGVAIRHGALLGAACYGTLGLTNGWSLRGFSPAWTFAIVAEGILFSVMTSGLTTWWVLRSAPIDPRPSGESSR